MSFEDLLKSLQSDYLTSLPEKIANIRGHIAKPSPDDLRECFHKLKGTGKTYGFPEVSELAELVESVCAEFPKSALEASQHGAALLEEIHKSRLAQKAFDVHKDARFEAIRKLLQH